MSVSSISQLFSKKPSSTGEFLLFHIPQLDYRTAPDLFTDFLRKNPDKPLLLDAGIDRLMFGAEILRLSRKLAVLMGNSNEILRGDKIAIISENRWEYVIILIAAVLNRTIVVPISPHLSSSEYSAIFENVKPHTVFCTRDIIAKLLSTHIESIIEINDDEFEPVHLQLSEILNRNAPTYVMKRQRFEDQAGNIFAIIYSSGTQYGETNPVTITNLNVAYCLQWGYQILRSTNTKYLGVVPFHNYFGLFSLLMTISSGNQFILLRQFDQSAYLFAIEKYKVEVLYATPSICKFLLNTTNYARINLKTLRVVVCGLGSITPDLEFALRLKYEIEMVYNYGLTESTYSLTHYLNPRRGGSIGTLYPNICLMIINDQNECLGPNKRGQICIKGPLVSKGYYNDMDLTYNNYTRDGYLKTGDLGYYDIDGYVYLLGRLEYVNKFHTFEASYNEIEMVLRRHKDVSEVAVLSLDIDQPQILVSLKNPVTSNKIMEYLQEKTQNRVATNAEIMIKTDLPRNIKYNINRRVLNERLTRVKDMLPDPTNDYPDIKSCNLENVNSDF